MLQGLTSEFELLHHLWKNKKNRLRCSDPTRSLQKNCYFVYLIWKIVYENRHTAFKTWNKQIMNSISEIIYTRQRWLFKSNQTHTSKEKKYIFQHNTNYVLHMKRNKYIFIYTGSKKNKNKKNEQKRKFNLIAHCYIHCFQKQLLFFLSARTLVFLFSVLEHS